MIRQCRSFGAWYNPSTWLSDETKYGRSTPAGTTSSIVSSSQYDEPIGPVMPASALATKPKPTPVPVINIPSAFDNPINLILAAGVLGMLGIGYTLVRKRG